MKLAVLLLAVSGALALNVGYQLYGGPEGPSLGISAPKPAPQPRTPLPKITHKEKRLYDGIPANNLFSPDRQPAADSGPTGSAPAPKRPAGQPGFVLKGVVITPEGRSALVKLDRERDYRKVVKGEIIKGWILESIQADSVTVKKEGTSTKVQLLTPKSVKPRRRGVPRAPRIPRRHRKR
jgi:hypothetical protein